MTVEPVVSSNDGVSVSRLVDQLLVFEQSSNSASVSDSIDLLSHVIKSIFKNGKQEAFIEQLRVYVHKKENEIERMCNFHYQVIKIIWYSSMLLLFFSYLKPVNTRFYFILLP